MHGEGGAIYLDDTILQIKLYQKQCCSGIMLKHTVITALIIDIMGN